MSPETKAVLTAIVRALNAPTSHERAVAAQQAERLLEAVEPVHV